MSHQPQAGQRARAASKEVTPNVSQRGGFPAAAQLPPKAAKAHPCQAVQLLVVLDGRAAPGRIGAPPLQHRCCQRAVHGC